MVTIKAQIELSEDGNTISSITSNNDGSKISSPIASVLGKKKQPQMVYPFFYGLSRFGEHNYTYMSQGVKLPYYMGEQISTNNGRFANPYVFTINGSDIFRFAIAFDTTNNGYPNSLTVDGKTIVNDSPVCMISVNIADTHTITISNWNKSNSPLIITGIYSDTNIEIDRDKLVSFESDISDRSNVQQPAYGIISNTANMVFNDFGEQALDLITTKILRGGIKVSAYYYDDIAGKQEQASNMFIQSLSYDSDNKQVNVTLKDNLEQWQKVTIPALETDITINDTKTAKYYFDYLYSKTIEFSSVNMLSFNELDSNTQSILNNTTVEYPILDEDFLWNGWLKLCELCLLHIYVDNNGRGVVKYNSGN